LGVAGEGGGEGGGGGGGEGGGGGAGGEAAAAAGAAGGGAAGVRPWEYVLVEEAGTALEPDVLGCLLHGQGSGSG
jgi:hypothetical protein